MTVRRDRGVTQTVAFVLVFSLVITSVGIVGVVGTDQLRQVQQNQQAESSAALIRAAGAGVTEVATGERPSYRSSVALAGGSLRVTNRTTVTVTVTNATGTAFTRTARPGALRYESNDQNVTYQSGLLARGGEGRRAVLLAGAGFRCAEDYVSVTLIELSDPDGEGVFGGGTATVRATAPRRAGTTGRPGLDFPTDDTAAPATGVNLTVSGPYEPAWAEALTERGFEDVGGGTYRCEVPRVFVNSPRVEVRLA
jgi:hypothetical protein